MDASYVLEYQSKQIIEVILMTTRVKEQHIVILGGGYGGLMTAIRLAGKTRRKPIKFTLINGLETFVNRNSSMWWNRGIYLR